MSATSEERASSINNPATARRHVPEIDLVRVLTFACVIGVHTVANTNSSHSVSANGLVLLLHFTRDAFFCLTGFVLVHQYLNRKIGLRRFWSRRLLLVGVPYVVWTVLFSALNQVQHRSASVPAALHQLASNLMFGTGWYHLYFLLVSLQIYAAYPLLAWLLRRTAGHHGALLAVSAALQLGVVVYIRYFPPRTGLPAAIFSHEDALLPCYQFYVILGALAAYHQLRLRSWISTRLPLAAAAVVASAAAAIAYYLLQVGRGSLPSTAAAIWQPMMILWSCAAVLALFATGIAWVRRTGGDDRLGRLLKTASDRSFGVFLVHPAVLWFVLRVGSGWLPDHLHTPWLSAVAYAATVTGSLVLTEIFRRSPCSLPLTGRGRLRAPQPPSRRSIPPREETDHARDLPVPA